jgi:hypothetical protein
LKTESNLMTEFTIGVESAAEPDIGMLTIVPAASSLRPSIGESSSNLSPAAKKARIAGARVWSMALHKRMSWWRSRSRCSARRLHRPRWGGPPRAKMRRYGYNRSSNVLSEALRKLRDEFEARLFP